MPGSTSQALGASADPAGGAARIRGAVRHYPAWLAGRYELMCSLGGGGMGVVYRAEDRLLGRAVAIKLLPRGDVADDPSLVARFEREARAAASLCHPNIVSVFDAGRDETTHFIVMEYVRGLSLAQLLSRDGRLQVGDAVDVARQIGRGLAAAHRAGIVHRDVKPANVMINDSGTVKLLDFGIAREPSSTSLTATGWVLGSSLYIAPEVARGGAAEERSDVYSLGCVLYEMVTGRPPFSGELDAVVLHQHASAQPPRPRARAAGVPQALDDLIMQMLSKRASARPSAASLDQALLGAGSRGTRTRTPRLVAHHAGASPTARLPALGRTRPRPRARLAAATLIVAVLAAMTLPATASNSRRGNGSSESSTRAAALRRIAVGGGSDARSGGLLPGIAGSLHAAAALATLAVADLEAARAAESTVAPRPTPTRGHHPARKGRTHSRKNQAEAPASEEAPSAERVGEGTTSVGQQAETPPVETTPTEAQALPPASGAATP